jgi:hypothetical protein|tara:strand:- start:1239 stop:1766 length:528 start_codon:yes stop_codon:yes gene_type:complete
VIEKRNASRLSLKAQTDAMVASGHVLGWREWVGLPDFGGPLIKAKVDTGARTSSIHATHIELIEIDHKKFVKFVLPHYRGDGHGRIQCQAPLLAIRHIRSSNGKQDERYIVASHIAVGRHRLKVELSLANRSLMGFPMLLGRTAIKAGRFLVQPAKSYLAGKPEHVYMAEQPVSE